MKKEGKYLLNGFGTIASRTAQRLLTVRQFFIQAVYIPIYVAFSVVFQLWTLESNVKLFIENSVKSKTKAYMYHFELKKKKSCDTIIMAHHTFNKIVVVVFYFFYLMYKTNIIYSKQVHPHHAYKRAHARIQSTLQPMYFVFAKKKINNTFNLIT